MPINIAPALPIFGWMSPPELTWLAQEASACRSIIEVGCYKGRTTRVLGDHVQPSGLVYSVDPWGGYTNDDGSQAAWATPNGVTWESVYEEWTRNVADLLHLGTVQCVRATSMSALNMLPSLVDFVFLDGDHREAAVLAEIAAYAPRVRKGGILAGHDYTHKDWPGVKAAVDRMFPAERINIVGSIWWVQL